MAMGDSMEEWQRRVITEKNEMEDRIGGLKNFLNSESSVYIEEEDRIILRWQLSIMDQYLQVLIIRIENFDY